MTRKFSLFAVIAAAAAVLAGCADPVVFAEVFQLEEDQKLYTAYNIWYTNPEEISCLNIQQGTFIPIGTEIEPIGTSAVMNNFGWSGFNEKITFRDKEGKFTPLSFLMATDSAQCATTLLIHSPPKPEMSCFSVFLKMSARESCAEKSFRG